MAVPDSSSRATVESKRLDCLFEFVELLSKVKRADQHL